MEPRAPLFPSLLVPLGDLYGVSSYRIAEAQMYAQDLDELEREELALEQAMKNLVQRKAVEPIGVKFLKKAPNATTSTQGHTTPTRLQRGGVAPVGSEGSRLGSGVATTRGYHGHVAEDGVEQDDEADMEEDELVELDDDDDEEEEEEVGRHRLGRGLFQDDDDDDALDDDEDPADSDSMDVSM